MSSLRSCDRKVLKRQLVQRDGDLCFYCKTSFNPHIRSLISTIDHKVPECLGGTHDIFNLVLCCNACNLSKDAKTLEEFLISEFLLSRRFHVFMGTLAA